MAKKEAMNPAEFRMRTRRFALRIIRLVEALPGDRTAQTVGGQLLRAGTSVGANYRAACRARSVAEFVSKMGIVEEELDESIYWMELLVEADVVKVSKLGLLMAEAEELLSMVVSSIKTARERKERRA